LKYALILLILLITAAGWPAVNTDIPTGKSTIGVSTFSPKDYGADITGASDATAAIQAAQAACVAAGGGEIRIDGLRLLHNSDITLVKNCPIKGSFSPTYNAAAGYAGYTSVLIHPATATIKMDLGSLLEGVLILAANLPTTVPTTPKQGSALVRGMDAGGTGITLIGSFATLRDVQLLGQAVGITSNGQGTLTYERVYIDARTGIFMRNNHGQAYLSNVQLWPSLTASQTWTTSSKTPTAVTNNGSNKVRFTVDTSDFTTNDYLFVLSLGGATPFNNRCRAVVVNATTLDCSDLEFAPVATGAVTLDSFDVQLTAGNKSIGNGSIVTSAAGAFPGGTVVDFIDPTTGLVHMNQKATATVAADTLTFAAPAYTSGGTVVLDNNYRPGIGFQLSANVLVTCVACNSYQHQTNYDLLDEVNDQFFGSMADFYSGWQDPTSVGVYLHGTTRSTGWYGGYIHGSGVSLLVDSTDPSLNVFSVPWINQGPGSTPTILAKRGNLNINNSYIYKSHTFNARVWVPDTIAKLTFANNDFSAATGYWSSVAAPLIRSTSTQFAAVSMSAGIVPSTTISGSTETPVAAGATVVFLHGQAASNPAIREPISGSGRMRNLNVENSVAPDTGTHVITVQRSSGDTLLTCTIPTGARTCTTNNTGIENGFGSGDNWNFKVVNSGTVTSTIKASVEWVPNQ
jgi:hypothetical protein